MKEKINILVFPCGSEVGLEIYRSLKYSRHINLFGGSSVDDHGKFVYENYIGDIPLINDSKFIPELKKIIHNFNIDAIYPAMDIAISVLKPLENELKCKIISSPAKTSKICFSKKETYKYMKDVVKIPEIFVDLKKIINYPVFIKPINGYGSRGAKVIYSYDKVVSHIKEWGECIITEYLPGEEYTVDCFTNRKRELLFIGPRPRLRTKTGISVNTKSIDKNGRIEFEKIAREINNKLNFQGAWFFQVKRNSNNELILLEIASRIGGSSLLYRFKGVNFALLSVFDAFGYDVKIIENKINIEIDRAFDAVVKFDYDFNNVYVDFDDCLIINGIVNTTLVAKLYHYFNKGKKIYLLTRHENDIDEYLEKHRLKYLFDEIIHIGKQEKKSIYIKDKNSIFIDDSFAERDDVSKELGIPVFAPDMIC